MLTGEFATEVSDAAGMQLMDIADRRWSDEILEKFHIIMDQLAASVPTGADGLLYLPYLMGERSPHPDPDCRGVFFGLSAKHNRSHLIRAVMEGVAFSQLECVQVFREMGAAVDDMMVCGGGGRSGVWSQMLSDLYACPVSTVHADEGPALGAAILAGVGAGLYSSVEQGCDAIIRKTITQRPDRENHERYRGYFELYKKLYRDLKDDFKRLSDLKDSSF